ncbi:MAG: DNA-processing protein DprA [bacterium]
MTGELLAILQLMLVPGLGAKTLTKLLHIAQSEGESIEQLVKQPVEELISRYGLRPGIAETVGDTPREARDLAELLDAHNIAMTRVTAEDLPSASVEFPVDFPPVLFSLGDRSLLRRPTVAFSGSRRALPTTLEGVDDVAANPARAGVAIISGLAPGVDLAAHAAALQARGATIAVLASGILHLQNPGELTPLADSDNLLILSEFLPHQNWTAYRAMRRNYTICDLADAVILAQPGLTGGTFAMGRIARARQRPLFLLEPQEPEGYGDGFNHFARLGVPTIKPGETDGLDSVLEAIAAVHRQDPARPDN